MNKRVRKKLDRLKELLKEEERLEAEVLRLRQYAKVKEGETVAASEYVDLSTLQVPPQPSLQSPSEKYRGLTYGELLVMEADGALVGEDLNWFRSKSGPTVPGQMRMPKL